MLKSTTEVSRTRIVLLILFIMMFGGGLFLPRPYGIIMGILGAIGMASLAILGELESWACFKQRMKEKPKC